jgi:hypothetical protein
MEYTDSDLMIQLLQVMNSFFHRPQKHDVMIWQLKSENKEMEEKSFVQFMHQQQANLWAYNAYGEKCHRMYYANSFFVVTNKATKPKLWTSL